MPIKICPIERSDAKVITEIQFGAFEDDPVNTLMYGGPPSTSVLAWTVEHTLNKWDENPVVKRMGVRDIATGELIAYSEWSFNPQREGDDWAKVPSMEWSKEHNKEVMDWLMTAHLNMNIKIMGPKPYILLSVLAVSPSHQRRGAGKLLLNWGIDQARTLNVPVFLTAAPAGLSLYRKSGFQAVDEVVIDVSSVSSEKRSNIAMLLAAPSPSEPPKTAATLPDADLPNEAVAPVPSVPQIPTATLAANYDVVIEPVTDDKDFVRMAAIEEAAFANDRLMQMIFPPGGASPSTEEKGANLRKSREDDPSNYYVKATSVATGEMVAWLKYHLYDDLSREHLPYPKELPPGCNEPLLKTAFGDLKERREKATKGKQYGFVLVLVTVPAWHRRGVGRKLLQGYLDLVDEKAWDSWIDASPAGIGLYEKLGWKEMGRAVVDLGDFGGEKGQMEETAGMIRKAKVKGEEKSAAATV